MHLISQGLYLLFWFIKVYIVDWLVIVQNRMKNISKKKKKKKAKGGLHAIFSSMGHQPLVPYGKPDSPQGQNSEAEPVSVTLIEN